MAGLLELSKALLLNIVNGRAEGDNRQRERNKLLHFGTAFSTVIAGGRSFMRVGRALGQQAIYFEVRVSGEIIDLE
jgi:hypothetical protein